MLIAALIFPACSRKEALTEKHYVLVPVRESIAKMDRLKSYRFHTTTTIEPASKLSHVTIKGVYNEPNKLQLLVKSEGKTINSIIVGNKIYLQNPATKQWQSQGKQLLINRPLDTIKLLSKFKNGTLVKSSKKLKEYRLVFNPKIFTKVILKGKLSDEALAKSKAYVFLKISSSGLIKEYKLVIDDIILDKRTVRVQSATTFSEFNSAPIIKLPAITS
jgi:outer membrane lipoprotein-sorting protein